MTRTSLLIIFIFSLTFSSLSLADEQSTVSVDSRSTPNHSKLLMSQVYGDSLFSFYSLEDDTFKIQIDRRENGQWITEAVNPSIKPWNNIVPRLFVEAEDSFFLKYSDIAYAIIRRDASGTWRLRLWLVFPYDHHEYIFSIYPNSVSIYENARQALPLRWIYGSLLISQNLESLDTGRLPSNDDEVRKLIDPQGWAVISSADEAGIRNMYTAPDISEDVLCALYDGAPVIVIDSQPDWAKIEVAGLVGWVHQASLVAGFEMLSVIRRFPDLVLLPENMTDETAIYALPTTDSPVLYSLKHLDSSVLNSMSVIGRVSEDWYVVFSPAGISGFMESKWFCSGNG